MKSCLFFKQPDQQLIFAGIVKIPATDIQKPFCIMYDLECPVIGIKVALMINECILILFLDRVLLCFWKGNIPGLHIFCKI